MYTHIVSFKVKEGEGITFVELQIFGRDETPSALYLTSLFNKNLLYYSTTGNDPNYLKLAEFRDLYPQIPILAVTATAKQQVITDIVNFLKLNNPEIIRANFDRPNLFLDIKELPEVPENTKPRFKKDTKYNMKADLIKYWIECTFMV